MSKLSYAEAWRWGGLPLVIIMTCWKLSGRKIYGPVLLPSSSGIIRLEPNQIEESQRNAIAPTLNELQLAGFEIAFWYKTETIGPVEGFCVALSSHSGDAVAMAIYSKSGVSIQVVVALVSCCTNGTYLSTSNARKSFTPPPEVELVRLPDQPAREVIRVHLKRVQGALVQRIRIMDIEPLILELQKILREENIRRGLYVPAQVEKSFEL